MSANGLQPHVQASMSEQGICKETVPGYPRLAHQMGLRPQLGIFRRFDKLQARNLLHMQYELIEREAEIDRVEKLDSTSAEGARSQYNSNLFRLYSSAGSGSFDEARQFNLYTNIRPLLKEYDETLLRRRAISQLHEPTPEHLRELQHYLGSESMGPNSLIGDESRVWGTRKNPNSRAADLVSLIPIQPRDSLSKLLLDRLMELFFAIGGARYRKADKRTGLIQYKESSIVRCTEYFGGALASLLPILAITVLWHFHSTQARLGIIAFANVIFTVCMMAMTMASQTEIFSIIATFDAVQVVFIGTNGSGDACTGTSCATQA